MTSLKRHVRSRTSAPRAGDDPGITLIVTMLVMMLMAALLAGFFAAVSSDMRSNALDNDSTRAYAAAHAGLEKLTSDLAQLFNGDVNPSASDINALLLNPPIIPGFVYTAPGGTAGSGYTVSWKADANGNPVPDDLTGSNIVAGPYRGLKGIITEYTVTITAKSTSGGSEMRLRRQLQTVAVPVFQFGVFSQGDLSFFAGPNFNFGGRVQTNGTLYLAEGDGNTLTMSDYVTAAGEVIRWQLSNGYLTSANYTGNVSIIEAQGGPFRNLARTEGSLVNGPGSASNDPTWTTLSVGTYKSYIRSSRTGGKALILPLVSQGATPIDLIRRPAVNEDALNTPVYQQRFYAQASLRILLSDRAADITVLPQVTATAPVALDNWIGGVPAGYGPVDATHPPIARSPGPMAATTTLNGNPTGANPSMVLKVNVGVPALLKMPVGGLTMNGVAGIQCTGKTATSFTGCVLAAGVTIPSNKAVTATLTCGTYTWNAATTTTAATGPGLGTFNIPVVNTAGFSQNFFWVDTTGAAAGTTPNAALVSCTGYTDIPAGAHQFTGCSYQGPNTPSGGDTITTNALVPQDAALNGGFIKIEKQDANGVWTDVTMELLNLGFASPNSEGAICADPNPNAVIRLQRLRDNGGICDYASSLNPYDYWPNSLFDTREGYLRDVAAGSAVTVGGVMDYVALDVNNLKKWFAGTTGATGTVANNNNGYIVYFSDRRGNHNAAAAVANAETGEYGSEDIINPASAAGTPDGVLEPGEDVNANGILDVYGQSPAACCSAAQGGNGPAVPAGSTAPLDATALPWTQFVAPNGNPGQARVNRQVLFRRALELVNGGIVGGVSSLPPGFTVAAENPVYVLGNYNATTASANAAGSVPAAILSDAVTLLSNQWTDGASFESPDAPNGRQANTAASYRMAVAAGKTLSFTKPVFAGAANDFGTDGGVHNFLRYLENWNGQTLNYNGSIVSLFTSRQAIGTYKCCTTVYSAPVRAYSFDTTFLTPSLLPPGTPMFRDLNTLTFRQILRPTQ